MEIVNHTQLNLSLVVEGLLIGTVEGRSTDTYPKVSKTPIGVDAQGYGIVRIETINLPGFQEGVFHIVQNDVKKANPNRSDLVSYTTAGVYGRIIVDGEIKYTSKFNDGGVVAVAELDINQVSDEIKNLLHPKVEAKKVITLDDMIADITDQGGEVSDVLNSPFSKDLVVYSRDGKTYHKTLEAFCHPFDKGLFKK